VTLKLQTVMFFSKPLKMLFLTNSKAITLL